MDKPSEEFVSALITTGSIRIKCEFCGREHFATGGYDDWEDGELEELKKKAEEQPHTYIENSTCDMISYGYIAGKQVVPGCSPECDEKLAHYEKWIVAHRFLITDFLKARAKKLKQKAKMEFDLATIKEDVDGRD